MFYCTPCGNFVYADFISAEEAFAIIDAALSTTTGVINKDTPSER